MNAEEVQEKQQFMRKQILEKGYDPEDFIEFLHQHISSDETPNIQQFSMKQIRKIVLAYQQHCSKNKNSPSDQTYTNQSQGFEQQAGNVSGKKVVEQNLVKILYEKYAPLYDYQMKGIIPCIQSDSLVKGNLEISVPNMETKEIEGYLFGIGSKTQYYYHVQTNLMKGPIKRLSEDFDWLNNTASRLYPFLALPELEQVRKDVKDPYLKRQKDIEEYLQYLARKKFLLSTHFFIDFLTISSDKMEKYKKSYDSMGFAKGVSLLKFPSGEVPIQLSEKSREFQAQSREFCKKTNKIHEALSLAIDKMITSYRQAVQQTYTVVDLFAELYDTFNDITNTFPQLKKQEYGDALVNLNNMFVGVGDSLKSTADLVQKYAKEYYRFTVGYDKNLLKLIRNVKQTEHEYLQFKYNLHRKKERVVSDPTKWEIDSSRPELKKMSKQELMRLILPKQTIAENQLKNWYAFNLKNQEIEICDYLRMCTHRYYKVYKNMAKQLLISDKTYLQALTKFIGECRRGSEY